MAAVSSLLTEDEMHSSSNRICCGALAVLLLRGRLARALRRLVIPLACLPLLLSACDRAVGSTDVHLDELPQLLAVEEMRIGSVDDPDLGFSWVVGLDVDREGQIYVVEGQDLQIRVYSPQGRLLRRIGGRGGGPGEFEGVPRFGVVGDTLWTWDSRNMRITLFDRQGNVLSTGRTEGVRVPLPNSFGYVLPRMMRSDGLFIGNFDRVGSSRDDPPTDVQETDEIPVPRVLFNADGQVVDTLAWDPSPPPRMWRPSSMEGSGNWEFIEITGRRHMVPDPPTTLPMWHPLEDGRLVIEMRAASGPDDAVFTVTRLDLEQDTVYHRAIRYAPEPYTAEQLDTIAMEQATGERSMAMINGQPVPPPDNADQIAAALRARMQFPPYQLSIQSTILLGDAGLWLRRTAAFDGESRWIVLDENGMARGDVTLPPRAFPLWLGGDEFWASVPDEFDVPWLVRYRLEATQRE